MAEVHLHDGRLRGEAAGGVATFRGVPFAAPPFGARRFRAPQPPEPWDGVRDATQPGLGCRQPSIEVSDRKSAYFNPQTYGPDCLNLNVATPDPGGSGLPVMVWIHGGGFAMGGGAAPMHAGTTWARDGVVHVSINYRLHVEGFCYLGPEAANLGLLDQVAALRWVQDNVAAFGGDPDNVTVFGQSAGAVSIMYLLAMPSAQGLFRRAIAQSGSSSIGLTVPSAERITNRLASLLGVPPTAAAFAEVDEDKMIFAVTNLAFEYLSPGLWGPEAFLISPYRPLVDGTIIPSEVVPAIERGLASTVDIMAGTTRDETTFAMYPLGLLRNVDDDWAALATKAFGIAPDALHVYDRPGAGLGDLLQGAWTDWAFRIPTMRLLEAHARQPGGTFAYRFDWANPSLPELGATHALEIAFVNDRLADYIAAMPDDDNPVGDDPPQQLADEMHRAWVAFATHGDPGWAPYDLERRTTMRFDTSSGPVDDPDGATRELWAGIR